MLPPFIALVAITRLMRHRPGKALDQFRRRCSAVQAPTVENLRGSRKSGLRVVTAVVFPHFASCSCTRPCCQYHAALFDEVNQGQRSAPARQTRAFPTVSNV